jgi:hypothetical protein
MFGLIKFGKPGLIGYDEISRDAISLSIKNYSGEI